MTRVEDDEYRDQYDGTEPPRNTRHRRRVWAVIVLLVVVPLLVLTVIGGWFWFQIDPPGKSGETVELRVDDGWSVSRIGDELADRNIIGSSMVFSVYARLSGRTDFQAGTYDLKRDMGVRDAVSTLEAGPRIDYVELAVPPGLWIPEIAERVGQLPGRSAQSFLEGTRNGSARSKYQPEGQTSLEGLLWPDTYRVADTEDEIDVIGSMVSQFEQHADALGLDAAACATGGAVGHTPYEILTVASLIQSEAKLDEDRPLIASVIYNRLREGMKLQIDATVLYAIGDPAKQNIDPDVDLAFDSPFNTYAYEGLPPTPIGSVTDASLLAACNPADTPYFFYVVGDANGKHVFAETGEEHEANVQRAREAGLL